MRPPILRSQYSFLRLIVVCLILLPVIFSTLLLMTATPDLETWLADKTAGYSRPDAFDHLTRIAPTFTFLLGITSLLATCFVLLHKSHFLVLLSVGPLVGVIVYLAEHGTKDPAWLTLFALLSIGMFIGSPATLLWIFVRGTVNAARMKSS